jgi:hypothetical protein
MPGAKTVERAKQDLAEDKSPSTAAGEFVREEMHHVREGKHGARSTKQAIAIGLSKARRAGVPLKPPSKGRTSERTREAAERAYEAGQGRRAPPPSGKRGRASAKALKREGRGAASKAALSRQAQRSARERRRTSRSPEAAARRGAATRMRLGIANEAARKAASTRKRRGTRR